MSLLTLHLEVCLSHAHGQTSWDYILMHSQHRVVAGAIPITLSIYINISMVCQEYEVFIEVAYVPHHTWCHYFYPALTLDLMT